MKRDKDIIEGLKFDDVLGNTQFKDGKRLRGRPLGKGNKENKLYVRRFRGIIIRTRKPITGEISNIILTELKGGVNVKVILEDGSYYFF